VFHVNVVVTAVYRRKWLRLEFRITENKNNLSRGLVEKSEIIQHMFEKDHTIN
jgi:hypothetical protein